jgi:hypothetical protein
MVQAVYRLGARQDKTYSVLVFQPGFPFRGASGFKTKEHAETWVETDKVTHWHKLLEVEQRTLMADERLTAAQQSLEQAKRKGVATAEMQRNISLIEGSLAAMSAYRNLLVNAVRATTEEIGRKD